MGIVDWGMADMGRMVDIGKEAHKTAKVIHSFHWAVGEKKEIKKAVLPF